MQWQFSCTCLKASYLRVWCLSAVWALKRHSSVFFIFPWINFTGFRRLRRPKANHSAVFLLWRDVSCLSTCRWSSLVLLIVPSRFSCRFVNEVTNATKRQLELRSRSRSCSRFKPVLRIWIRLDPHYLGSRIRIRVKSRIRIQIGLCTKVKSRIQIRIEVLV
jgi:hypothetical protein